MAGGRPPAEQEEVISNMRKFSSGPRSAAAPKNRQAINDLIIGAALVVFGIWVLWTAAGIPTGAAYAAVDARFFPRVVGVGLSISGLGILIGVWRSWRSDAAGDETVPLDWASLLAIAGILLAYILLYLPLGFILASTLLMVAGARVFSSTKPLRDGFWGLVVSVATYLLFTRVIRMELPTGWIWEVLF